MMDERTRRTDDGAAPVARRSLPLPDVKGLWRSHRRLGIGLVAILILFGLYETVHWLRSPPAVGRFPQGAQQTVGAATVATGNIRVIISELGTVTPLATITVQTQIDGRLMEVPFTEGQMVKKGDTLAQIDDRPYQLQQAQFEGQLARDQGILAQAQLDLARYQKLSDQNSIARQQYEDQVWIVQQDIGTVKLDQAQVDQQKLNVQYCHIVSPVTGRVGLRQVDPGNYVQVSNSTGIAVVTQLQPITVIFTVPEDDLPEIMPQFYAGTELVVTAYDRANIRQLATGKVLAVDNQIDVTTGTVKVRAQFDNTDNALFPSQFVNARLLVKTLENVVTVPTAAIQRGAPGAYVYVINADSTVSVRQITTGAIDGDITAVNSGLSTGERVVVDGTDRLRDGLHVSVAPPAGQPAAPGRAQYRGAGQNRPSGSHAPGTPPSVGSGQ
jgi:membrane fusion protein, multidrug efflux system